MSVDMDADNRLGFVTCAISMHFAPADVSQAVQLLVSAVGRTEATPGCTECSVARDATDDGLVHYRESWESEAGLQQHLKTDVFRRVLTAMDMCNETPKVTVGNVSGRRGIACLQELCDRKNANGT